MSKLNTIFKVAPTVISMLKMNGINVDESFNNALKFIPEIVKEKQREYQEIEPEMDINLMVSFKDNDVYLIPVGLVQNFDGKIIVSKQFEVINVSKFLDGIKISEVLSVLKKDPTTPIMEAIEKSRV